MTAFDLAAKLDAEFGPQTRPDTCHDCHSGSHTDLGRGMCLCPFCRCVQRLAVPAEIAAELQMAGAR